METDAGVNITHDEFLFSLDGDWLQVRASDSEQFLFESKQKQTSVVLSLQYVSIPQGSSSRWPRNLLRFVRRRSARPVRASTFGSETNG